MPEIIPNYSKMWSHWLLLITDGNNYHLKTEVTGGKNNFWHYIPGARIPLTLNNGCELKRDLPPVFDVPEEEAELEMEPRSKAGFF